MATTLLIACAPAEEEPAPEVTALPTPPMIYELYGTPGPWWREGSTRTDFDAAAVVCVEASIRAREFVSRSERAEAAYRGFLECMQASAWTRGQPPPAAPPVPSS